MLWIYTVTVQQLVTYRIHLYTIHNNYLWNHIGVLQVGQFTPASSAIHASTFRAPPSDRAVLQLSETATPLTTASNKSWRAADTCLMFPTTPNSPPLTIGDRARDKISFGMLSGWLCAIDSTSNVAYDEGNSGKHRSKYFSRSSEFLFFFFENFFCLSRHSSWYAIRHSFLGQKCIILLSSGSYRCPQMHFLPVPFFAFK